jgi:hypothetical protein
MSSRPSNLSIRYITLAITDLESRIGFLSDEEAADLEFLVEFLAR